MSLTIEQQKVVDTALMPVTHLIKVEACAGAGKTHTLIELAKALNPDHGLYLAYNKAIATEAAEKFAGTNIECKTIHSLAYKAIVRQWGLKIGWFNARDVRTKELDFKGKKKVVAVLDGFLNSPHTSQDDYFDEVRVDELTEQLVRHHLDLMAEGEIASPHSFYLKMYQVLLKLEHIPKPQTNLLMLDEFGDITGITLDIFNMITAEKKVAVGDTMQNIYSFNNTVNGFAELQGIGHTVKLTQSFRVSDVIASQIQGFVRDRLDPEFEFKGRTYPADYQPKTKGYIARTNSGLFEEMLRLQEEHVPFHTTRKIELVLELPLILANLNNGKSIEGAQYKVIENLRKKWILNSKTDTEFAKQYKTPLRYVLKQMQGDDEISRAANVVTEHGPYVLNALVKYAKECSKAPCNLTLTTGHSSKGLEFDVVELAPDFDDAMKEASDLAMKGRIEGNEKFTKAAEEEYRLYYVACSRALVELHNANSLPRAMIKG